MHRLLLKLEHAACAFWRSVEHGALERQSNCCCAGKTRCINHFLINNSWYLVDLPGYGYAKASQDKRIAWNEFTKTFFLERQPLVEVLLLIDCSVPPQQIDFECAMWLSEADVPFSIIFTKGDKAKKKTLGIEENIQSFCHDLEIAIGRQAPTFLTSAATGSGAASVLFHSLLCLIHEM